MRNRDAIAAEILAVLASFTPNERAALLKRFGVTLSDPPKLEDLSFITTAQIEEVERDALAKLRGEH